MSEWVFYSAAARLVSAGDLLRAIPSRRNLRLERSVLSEGERTTEAVRAAEFLLGLEAVLRLTNEPDGFLRLSIRDTDHTDREDYRALGCTFGPAAQDLRVTARVVVPESSTLAGHGAMADDVMAGLEGVFPGGVAANVARTEVLRGADLARVTNPDRTPFSHVDAQFFVSGERSEYLAHLLVGLPSGLLALMRPDERGLGLYGRIPLEATPEELVTARNLLLDCAAYASGGCVRFRHEGVWQDAVEGIGVCVAPLPAEWLARRSGVRAVLSKLFKR